MRGLLVAAASGWISGLAAPLWCIDALPVSSILSTLLFVPMPAVGRLPWGSLGVALAQA
jgi:hypothetical protein